MKLIVLVSILVTHSIVAFTQPPFYLFINNVRTDVKLSESIAYLNIITEREDSIYNGEVSEYDSIRTVAVFDSSLSSWRLNWIKVRNSELVQTGIFNSEGMANGTFEKYLGGLKGKCTFINGKKEGIETYYITNESMWYCQYIGGKLNGYKYEITYGKYLTRIMEYKDGLRNGFDRFYWLGDSNLYFSFEIKYAKGKVVDGIYYYYSPRGYIMGSQKYKNGLLHGLEYRWRSNGQVWQKTRYKKGVAIKRYKVYDPLISEPGQKSKIIKAKRKYDIFR